MEYLVPPGKEAPKEVSRDVSADMASAQVWLKTAVKDVVEVHAARELVQAQFPSLVNDEAFACVMAVKEEWSPKIEPLVEEAKI